jgi:hypothetical protein
MLANKIITERLKGQKTISPQTPNVIESNSNKEG